jgi:hypothetical protein
MLSEQIFGFPPPSTASKKELVSKEANIIKEQMVGYTNAIIERQDRYDILKKMESFNVESSARKVMTELVSYFTESQKTVIQKVENLKTLSNDTMDKFDL